MRRQDYVVERQQRRIRRKRLLRVHVQPRAQDFAILQGLVERFFVDDVPARRTHNHGVFLHHGKAFGVDKVVRLIRVRDVDADGVGLPEQFVEFDFPRAGGLQGLRRLERVVGQHFHVVAAEQLREDFGNHAVAQKAQLLAAHFAADALRAPLAGVRHEAVVYQLPLGGHNHGHSHFGDGLRVGPGRARDCDAVRGRVGEVDGLKAHAVADE